MGYKSLLLSITLLSIYVISTATNVSYDSTSLLFDGERKHVISGSIHYPRSTPEMWPDLIQKAKDGGLDTIETYIFWNAHEPQYRQYDFSGNLNFIEFIKTIQDTGLNCILRVGPYVCAEWTYGGFPVWLHNIPGIEFRTYNQPFMNEMKTFVTLIIDMVKKEKLFASQGGPIILAQIENEYGNAMGDYGDAGLKYIQWCAEFAESLNVGVPWMMCQQNNPVAPPPMLVACNGHYCDSFTPNNSYSPKMWTENWVGWFENWGQSIHHRPAEDVAFSVARFFQLSGSLMNYYMYHGGTNFGRSAGGPLITTSYHYDAPLDEYGGLNEPKWSHLKDLHLLLKSLEKVMLYGTATTKLINNNTLEYSTIFELNGTKACFIGNSHDDRDISIELLGKNFTVPAWSVTILKDCKIESFNTARVRAQTSVKVKVPSRTNLAWVSKTESPMHYKDPVFERDYLMKYNVVLSKEAPDQKIANDTSDYMWYMTEFTVNDPNFGEEILLHANVSGPIIHVFLNGKHIDRWSGSYSKHGFIYEQLINVVLGETYRLSVLTVNAGYANYDPFYDTYVNGISGPVKLISQNNINSMVLTNWELKSGLNGYIKRLPLGEGEWDREVSDKPFVWFKTTFDTPRGTDPVVVDLLGMGKGLAWVNGFNIGRYWPSAYADNQGCDSCDYRADYSNSREHKCRTECGTSTQRWYHIPRSVLSDNGNTMVLFDEFGGDPSNVSIQTVPTGQVCANAPENTTLVLSCQDYLLQKASPAFKKFRAATGKFFTRVSFASFGNANGTCGTVAQPFQKGTCDSPNTLAAIQKACIGKELCAIDVSEKTFGTTNCNSDVAKKLLVSLKC